MNSIGMLILGVFIGMCITFIVIGVCFTAFEDPESNEDEINFRSEIDRIPGITLSKTPEDYYGRH